MKTKWMTLTALAVALTSTMAFASPKPVQSNGTHPHENQYHDRTPHVHDRGPAAPR